MTIPTVAERTRKRTIIRQNRRKNVNVCVGSGQTKRKFMYFSWETNDENEEESSASKANKKKHRNQ